MTTDANLVPNRIYWSERLILLAMAAFLALNSHGAHADSTQPQSVKQNKFQSLETIRQAARNFLNRQIQADPSSVEFSIDHLDSRLQLSTCTTQLEAFLPGGSQLKGNTTIGLRCPTAQGWTLYVSANIRTFQQVLVTTKSLPRGTLLSPDDFKLVRRDVHMLSSGYLTDGKVVKGKELKRGLSMGAVISASIIKKPQLVRRGEQITIFAKIKGLEVRMQGKALMNGTLGDTITVRNLSSKRKVDGTVVRRGTIKIRL